MKWNFLFIPQKIFKGNESQNFESENKKVCVKGSKNFRKKIKVPYPTFCSPFCCAYNAENLMKTAVAVVFFLNDNCEKV